jgi:hypothetical protein
MSSSLGIRAEVYSQGYLRRKAIPERSLRKDLLERSLIRANANCSQNMVR